MYRTIVAASAATLVVAGLTALSPAAAHAQDSGTPGERSFSYTGQPQSFTVPDGVYSIDWSMAGGSGGVSITIGGPTVPASHPAYGVGSFDVVPGEVLTIYVAQAGGDWSPYLSSVRGGPGGWGYRNGGDGGTTRTDLAESRVTGAGAGGGGSSAIVRGGAPVAVVSGGGGSGSFGVYDGRTCPPGVGGDAGAVGGATPSDGPCPVSAGGAVAATASGTGESGPADTPPFAGVGGGGGGDTAARGGGGGGAGAAAFDGDFKGAGSGGAGGHSADDQSLGPIGNGFVSLSWVVLADTTTDVIIPPTVVTGATVTADVAVYGSSASSPVVDSGTVQILEGGRLLGEQNIVGGEARVPITVDWSGSADITVAYVPGPGWGPSQTQVQVVASPSTGITETPRPTVTSASSRASSPTSPGRPPATSATPLLAATGGSDITTTAALGCVALLLAATGIGLIGARSRRRRRTCQGRDA